LDRRGPPLLLVALEQRKGLVVVLEIVSGRLDVLGVAQRGKFEKGT
jgi:hypothetical protein